MELQCQSKCVEDLKQFAERKRNSVIISGFKGLGKSYLARQYSDLLHIKEFYSVSPKIDDIRNLISQSVSLKSKIVVCVENLDLGVIESSYALLKFVEEPTDNVFIVITCRNLQRIPDTILSRCVMSNINPPSKQDIDNIAKAKDDIKYRQLKNHVLWKCIGGFSDIDTLYEHSENLFTKIDEIQKLLTTNSAVSQITWKLGHYDDNKPTPIELIIRYIMEISNKPYVTKLGISAISDLNNGNVGSAAVLQNFVLNYKYGC